MRIGYDEVWTFTFKSRPEFFHKEKKDVKNNTIRKIDLHDRRCIRLLVLADSGWNDGEARIEIANSENPDDFFIRNIRDISVFNGFMIITWIPRKKELFSDHESIAHSKRIYDIGTGKVDGQKNEF